MSSANTPAETNACDPMLEELLRRVRAEFLEMPGLRVTRAQARRLWALDPTLCETVLAALVESNFLVQCRGESFIRAA